MLVAMGGKDYWKPPFSGSLCLYIIARMTNFLAYFHSGNCCLLVYQSSWSLDHAACELFLGRGVCFYSRSSLVKQQQVVVRCSPQNAYIIHVFTFTCSSGVCYSSSCTDAVVLVVRKKIKLLVALLLINKPAGTIALERELATLIRILMPH